MINVELFSGKKRIPSLRNSYSITLDGIITDENNDEISFDEFNCKTGNLVSDITVLIAITYQKFNWPPVYWKHLLALKNIEDVATPESITLGIDKPVESIEYPGFYMIPYFSNYVISEDGLLLRKNGNLQITASEGNLGYRTFRMVDDSGKTQNQLRHRILCYAFKPYSANVEDLDVNHKDGVPGNDSLENLEWCTRTENMHHAYSLGLRDDNKPVQVKDINLGKVFIFSSCSSAGRMLNVTETTISNRAKTSGFKAFNGMQFRFHPNSDPWPTFESAEGKYLIEFPDGTRKQCGCNEAARLVGLTRTSLLRALREGRQCGTTQNKVTRLE